MKKAADTAHTHLPTCEQLILQLIKGTLVNDWLSSIIAMLHLINCLRCPPDMTRCWLKYSLFNSGLLLLLCFTVLFPGSASPVYQALLKIPSNSFVSCSNFSLQCALLFKCCHCCVSVFRSCLFVKELFWGWIYCVMIMRCLFVKFGNF